MQSSPRQPIHKVVLPPHIAKAKGAAHGHLTFGSAMHSTGLSFEMNWTQYSYAMQIAGHTWVNDKLKAPLITPWTPEAGAVGRKATDFGYTTQLVFDLDKISIVDIDIVKEWCNPYSSLVHTTYSHGVNGLGCFRVYMVLSAPVSAAEYRIIHAGVLKTLPEISRRVDPTCADPCRCYFLPSCPPEMHSLASIRPAMDGIEVDVSKFLPQSHSSANTVPPNEMPAIVGASRTTQSEITALMPSPATQGQRNQTLASTARRVYVEGYTPEAFFPVAINWGRQCQPPMDDAEVDTTVKSMWRTHARRHTQNQNQLSMSGNPLISIPPWVAELNERYALVRHGSKVTIVDFQTPSMTGRGLVNGFGFMDASAFHSTLRGRYSPDRKSKTQLLPLSYGWLEHLARRQYDGLVFAPSSSHLPANVLNLWQGFAVAPVLGDVAPWLNVLGALVPDPVDRAYVLKWLAWKIQNPGGVPDTVLIFKGAKGAGKNSLLDPLIPIFGVHAMLASDPELIAGRFTFHLMYLAFAVLDEAVFIGDPKQADRIKSRVTAKEMHYEQKGLTPVSGVNRCAYVMLTNHDYVWQATVDERRAVVIEVGDTLRNQLSFWSDYHSWVGGAGPSALLHHLLNIDLTGFNPRAIPKGEALRKQVEQTALRSPSAAWWHQCLTEGAIRYRDGSSELTIYLEDTKDTEISRCALRKSYEQSAAGKYRNGSDWASVAKQLISWAGPAGIRKVKGRTGTGREYFDVFPPLPDLRATFSKLTKVRLEK